MDSFLSRLRTELSRWQERGIIDGEQARQILELYPEQAAAHKPERSVMQIVPAILIGFAAVLIAVGLILFYAANWNGWSATTKLVQIFAFLILVNGGAAYLLLVDRRYPVAGRGLLMTGMLAYGAAIGLVAQIFHISARPTNGILTWLLGALAASIVMRERWGYYLALVLAFIWNVWELGGYSNPNYAFAVFPLLLFALFRRERDQVGMLLAFAAGLFWFYQVSFFHLSQLADLPDETHLISAVIVFVLSHLPLGALLIAGGWIGSQRPGYGASGFLARLLGWCFALAPFLLLSWPFEAFAYDWRRDGAQFFTVQFFILTAGAAGLIALLGLERLPMRVSRARLALPAGVLAVGACLLVTNLGAIQWLVSSMHVALLAFLCAMLYTAFLPDANADGMQRTAGLERALAILFAAGALVIKGLGLFIYSLTDDEYFLAYNLGFVIFAIVVFLINQFVHDALKREATGAGRTTSYPVGALDGVTALLIWLSLYAVSFQIDEQKSIFAADPIVITLATLFIGLALGLFSLLLYRRAAALPVYLSAAVFLASVFTLFVAGPEVPSPAYSILFNGLLFIATGALIYYSTQINSTALANAGIALFGLHITTRFFDTFWALLSGSLFFLATGVFLFAAGFLLERNRRKLIERIRESENDEDGGAALSGSPDSEK